MAELTGLQRPGSSHLTVPSEQGVIKESGASAGQRVILQAWRVMTLISGSYKEPGVLNDRPEITKSGAACLHFCKSQEKNNRIDHAVYYVGKKMA